jgi:hypothetical protein
MNSANVKNLVDNFKISLKNQVPETDTLVKLCSKSIHYLIGDGSTEKFYPRFGYIGSNLKGEYFIVYCDSCNSKCRKIHIKVLTLESKNIIKFLCFRCAGVRYRRRSVSEKKAFQLITNPNSYHFISKSHHSDVLAFLEAEFIRDEFSSNNHKKHENQYIQF